MQFCNTKCEADGKLNVNFNVTCRPSVATNDCPIIGTNQSISATLTLNTASFCAILIEAVNVQGEMFAYKAGTMLPADLSDNFLTDNIAYFKASFSAFVEDGNGSPPSICGVSPIRVDIASIAGSADPFTTPTYADTLWQATGGLPTIVPVGATGFYQGGDNTTAGDALDFHMMLSGSAITAIETTALGGLAHNAAPQATWENNLVGFRYLLGSSIAPPSHGSFRLTTTLLVNFVFCNTGTLLGMQPDTRLLEIAFNDRYETYTDEELLQLQEGPQNMAEVGATVGMFDPFPEVEESPEEVVELPAKPQEEEIGKPENNAVPVTGTESATEIWPVIAGVVGGVTICIIVLLIGLRRRNHGKKTKTVAVVPNSQEYGKVAVAATEDSGAETPTASDDSV